jgi:hypothetical protein
MICGWSGGLFYVEWPAGVIRAERAILVAITKIKSRSTGPAYALLVAGAGFALFLQSLSAYLSHFPVNLGE